jgi:hypothetical protein
MAFGRGKSGSSSSSASSPTKLKPVPFPIDSLTNGNGKAHDPTTGIANGPSSKAVGLSNPQMSQQQRRMLDLVNGLHSTGYAHFPFSLNKDWYKR